MMFDALLEFVLFRCLVNLTDMMPYQVPSNEKVVYYSYLFTTIYFGFPLKEINLRAASYITVAIRPLHWCLYYF